MYDLLIKGGKVVTPKAVYEADVLVKGEKIAAIGLFDDVEVKRVIDATGKYVMPGVIEAHMHCQAPFQGCLGANTFYEQSISGAFGGVTTFMDFANMSKGQSPYKQVLARLDEMSESAIDYSCHGKFIACDPKDIEEIEQLAEAGVPTFKCFMTYRKEGVMSDDDTLLRVFRKAKEVGGCPMVHAEDNGIAENNLDATVARGDTSWRAFADCKPIECEATAFDHAVDYANYVGSPLIVVHTTNKLCLDKARDAHAKGQPVYVETGPHYLTLFDDLYDTENGHLAICSPPLRTPKDAEDLWDGLMDGTILLTGSDDCTFDFNEKEAFLERDENGKLIQDFRKVVNGLTGLEQRLPILLSEGVSKGRLTISQVSELTSTNIAKVYGCYPQKGILAPGSDADICIVDMDKEVVFSTKTLHNNISYCLHDGMKVKGYPIMTISRGEVLVEDGEFKGSKGRGKVVKRKIDPQYLEKYGLEG